MVAEASAWAARMRFALADAGPALEAVTPGFKGLVVRVRPRRSGPGKG